MDVRSDCVWGRAFVTGAASLAASAAHAIGSGPGQGDESGELLFTALVFPVITLAASAVVVMIGRRAGRPNSVLRAFLGALIGLLLTAVLAVALMASSVRDAAFVATSVFTLGALPTGLIGLIVGGLVAIARRKPSAP